MSDAYQMNPHKNQSTEYNSNQFIVMQIAKLNESIQNHIAMQQFQIAKSLLRQYYTMILPKLISFKKHKSKDEIDLLFKNLKAYESFRDASRWYILQKVYDKIYCAADSVGLGMTDKKKDVEETEEY